MIDLAEYTGPVINIDCPHPPRHVYEVVCTECWQARMPSFAQSSIDDLQPIAPALPTALLKQVAKYIGGSLDCRVYMGQCGECGTVYQSWYSLATEGIDFLIDR
jgi:hypothetical protein